MKNRWHIYLAFGFAIWFALTGWLWTSLINIFIAYPFGVAALLIYIRERRQNPNNPLNRKVFIVLIVGWIVSIGAALLFK